MEDENREIMPQNQTAIMTEGLPMLVKGALQRTYLEDDVFSSLSQSIRMNTISNKHPLISQRIRRVGAPSTGDWNKIVDSLGKTLTGCHKADAFQLCYRLDYDGSETSISFGLRTKNAARYSARDYLSNITSVFSEQTPGTVFDEVKEGANTAFPKRDYFAPITGIPGLGDRQPRDLVGSVIAAVGDKPFSVLIAADSISSAEIESALFACRQMLSQAETLKSISVSEAENWATQISQQQTTTESKTTTKGSSESSKSKGAVLALGGLSAAATVLGGPYLGSLILMAGGSMMSNYTTSVSDAVTTGVTSGTGVALTQGGSASKTMNFSNAHMAEVAEKLSRFAERLESAKVYGAWNVSVYIMADDEVVLDKVGLTVKGMATGKDAFLEPIRVHDFANIDCDAELASELLSKNIAPEWSIVLGKVPQVHPLGKSFSGLSTPLSSTELAQWFALPHDDVAGLVVSPYVGGFSLSRSTKKDGMIDLGISRSLAGVKVPYRLGVDSFVRHTFLTGMPRRGKSTTCRRILEQIREIKGPKFPFLIIEPAKTEYLEWAIAQNKKSGKKIKVFMPGYSKWRDNDLDELAINPFEVIWEDKNLHPDVVGHIQNLAAIINASLPMQEGLPLLMEEAIYKCYADEAFPFVAPGKSNEFYKWVLPKGYTLTKKAPYDNRMFPTFETLVQVAKRVVGEKKYHSDANRGFMAALNTRISSFLRPPKSKTFLTDGKSAPGFWRSFFSEPMVINLSRVGSDEDKAFYMAIILMFLYEYRQQEIEHSDYTNSLRHLLIIEEAHSLLRKSQRQGMAVMDPAGKAVGLFANMIAEIGAFGQGVMIIDQSPSSLDDSVVKNTNTKIIHRLGDGADIERMARAINLPPDKQQVISKLANGEVIISTEDDERPSRVEVLPDSSVVQRSSKEKRQ